MFSAALPKIGDGKCGITTFGNKLCFRPICGPGLMLPAKTELHNHHEVR
jgi:hypothetical protein